MTHFRMSLSYIFSKESLPQIKFVTASKIKASLSVLSNLDEFFRILAGQEGKGRG